MMYDVVRRTCIIPTDPLTWRLSHLLGWRTHEWRTQNKASPRPPYSSQVYMGGRVHGASSRFHNYAHLKVPSQKLKSPSSATIAASALHLFCNRVEGFLRFTSEDSTEGLGCSQLQILPGTREGTVEVYLYSYVSKYVSSVNMHIYIYTYTYTYSVILYIYICGLCEDLIGSQSAHRRSRSLRPPRGPCLDC